MSLNLLSIQEISQSTINRLYKFIPEGLMLCHGRVRNGVSFNKRVKGFKLLYLTPHSVQYISDDGSIEVQLVKPIQPPFAGKHEYWVVRAINSQTEQVINDPEFVRNFENHLIWNFMKA